MKALVFKEANQPIALQEIEKPQAENGQVIVEMKAAALNHRDVWITKGLYPDLTPNVVVGSDGVGIVKEKEVILNPNVNWGEDPRYFSKDYSILGMPTHGTFAEYLAIDEDRLVEKPVHLTMEQAAALPLGGMTAYRVLFIKCQAKAGDKILISGVGGGVALFAFQFALAIGAEVYVTSGSREKIESAIAMGAAGGANYKEEKWHKKFGKEVGGFDVIIDSAAGEGFGQLAALCNPCARIGIYGGTRGLINKLSPQLIFWKQLEIYGSTMGSDDEFVEMIKFVKKHKIVPVVDSVFDLTDGPAAFERMEKGLQFGKIVLKI